MNIWARQPRAAITSSCRPLRWMHRKLRERRAIASNKAVEAETNSILVTNILRARDGVPTYFSDISHLRGSLQAQASIQAPLGVGDYKNWTGRSLVSPGAYVQVNPSFDVAPLNTQGFTKGINEPLDVRVFQYYLDHASSSHSMSDTSPAMTRHTARLARLWA
jgi:hypothetical protein